MAWDSSRAVPWRRLVREWLLYVGIMAVVFMVLFRDQPLLGIFAGLLISGPLYLAFGYVMAKFGYQRKSFKQLRADAPSKGARDEVGDDDEHDRPRPKPAPTSRTGGGSQRPTSKSKRRR